VFSEQSYQDVFVESLIDTVLSHFANCRPVTTIVAAGLLLNLVHSPNKASCLKPKHQEKLEVGSFTTHIYLLRQNPHPTNCGAEFRACREIPLATVLGFQPGYFLGDF